MKNSHSGKSYGNSEVYDPAKKTCLNLCPVLPIATLSNYFENVCCDKKGPHHLIADNCKMNHVILNVISLEEEEFFNIFFDNIAKYFCVSKLNVSNNNIILSEQSYISNNSTINRFSLYNELLKCFEENYSISANNINPRSLISLQKETFKTQSLASICGTQVGLSWDQVINSLISNGYIEYSSKNSCAPVIFQVNLNFYSCAIHVDLNITFQYKVHISGYSLTKKYCPVNECCDSSSSSSSSCSSRSRSNSSDCSCSD